jgi:Fe2+ transport system protein FeoA
MTSARATLWDLPVDQPCEVNGFDEDMPEAFRVRLMEFGFHPGESVVCLQTPALGAPRVYRVSNTVYSLDREIAKRVYVSLTALPGQPA